MGGFSIVLFALPFILAIIGVIIGLLFFIAVCLLIMGISGIIMNRIYASQANGGQIAVKGFYNICSVILGIFLIMLPLGYVFYVFISAILKS